MGILKIIRPTLCTVRFAAYRASVMRLGLRLLNCRMHKSFNHFSPLLGRIQGATQAVPSPYDMWPLGESYVPAKAFPCTVTSMIRLVVAFFSYSVYFCL